jgi:hypothetical protein
VDDSEAWLNTLASISADEVEFNMAEANRADQAREMADWGFDVETIKNTFGIAVDDELEKDEVEGMKTYRDESYWDDEDWKAVESHTKVERDPDSGDPFRQQMVSMSGWELPEWWSLLFVSRRKFSRSSTILCCTFYRSMSMSIRA